MKGKILGEKFYTVMLPYKGYWPEVHEIRYEPDPSEEGKDVRFWRLEGHWWKALMPQGTRLERFDIEMSGKTHSIPFKAVLGLENVWFESTGPSAYDLYGRQGCGITHLIIEKNGEQLADYIATFGYADRRLYAHHITFGDDNAGGQFRIGEDIPHVGMVDGSAYQHLFPSPLEMLKKNRFTSDDDLFHQLDSVLDRLKERPSAWNRLAESPRLKDLSLPAVREMVRIAVKPGDILLVKLGDPSTGWIPGPDAEKRILDLLKEAELKVPAIIWNYGIDVSAIEDARKPT